MEKTASRTGYLVWAVDNVVYGPVPMSLLVQWVEEGRVQAGTWVFHEATENWRKAGEIAELKEWLKANEVPLATAGEVPPPIASIKLGALRRVKILSILDDQALERLRQRLQPLLVPAWKPIVKEGDPADGMYLIMEGEVRVRLVAGGKENIIATLETGDFFGELALFDHGPRSADVYANTDVLLLKLSASEFQKLVVDDPELAAPFLTAVCKTMAARMRTDNKRYAVSLSMARFTPSGE
jgi:hypothetical protein